MYEQASAVATELGIEREPLDEWALRSHQRAIAAIDEGRLAEEIVAVDGTRAGWSTPMRARAATPRWRSSRGCARWSRSTRRTRPATRPGSTTAPPRSCSPTRTGRGSGVSCHSRGSAASDTRPTVTTRSRAYPRWRSGSRSTRAGLAVADLDRIEINEAFASVAVQSTKRSRRRDPTGSTSTAARSRSATRSAPRARACSTTLIYELRRRGGGLGARGDLLGRRPGRRDGARGHGGVIERVLVVGAGQMGAGIAQVAAQRGRAASRSWTSRPRPSNAALEGIGASLAKLHEKGKVDDPEAGARADRRPRRRCARRPAPVCMIEAVSESFELKARIFREADELLGSDAILATEHLLDSDRADRRARPAGRPRSAACTS